MSSTSKSSVKPPNKGIRANGYPRHSQVSSWPVSAPHRSIAVATKGSVGRAPPSPAHRHRTRAEPRSVAWMAWFKPRPAYKADTSSNAPRNLARDYALVSCRKCLPVCCRLQPRGSWIAYTAAAVASAVRAADGEMNAVYPHRHPYRRVADNPVGCNHLFGYTLPENPLIF